MINVINNKEYNMEAEKVKCLIIGSGPAGYTAAIYAAPRQSFSGALCRGCNPVGS